MRHFRPEGRVITNHITRYRGGEVERTFSDRDKGLRTGVHEGRESLEATPPQKSAVGTL